MLQFADMIPAIHGLGFIQTGTDKIVNAAADTSKFLSSVAAVQATTAVVTAVLQQSGKHFVDSEDIKDEAEQVIRKITEETHKEELNRIYATDEINENRILQDRLHNRIEHEVYRHQGKFHDDKTQFGVGLDYGAKRTKKIIYYDAENFCLNVTGIYFEDSQEIDPKYNNERLRSCLDSIFKFRVLENLGGQKCNFKKGDWLKIKAVERCIVLAREYMPLEGESTIRI